MTATELLLNPTGMDGRSDDVTLAPRPSGVRGLTVGLLDNTKANATALLSGIGGELGHDHGVAECRMYTKDYFGTPVATTLLDQIARECDVVVTAVGDCGSCSAATVIDGILFERAGIPAVSICSDSFTMSARAMAKVQGFPGFDFVVAPHPIASLNATQLRNRAHALVPEVLRVLGADA